MTQCTANFETGVNGNNISPSDAGSATAFDEVNAFGGGTVKYDNAHAYGALAAKVVGLGAASNNFGWSTAMGTVTNWYGRMYLYLTAYPASGTYRIFQDQVNGSNRFHINIGGGFSVEDNDGFAINMAVGVPLNAWCRIEWHLVHSATVGQWEMKLFLNPDSATPTEAQTSAANRNTGANTNSVLFGLCSGGGDGSLWIDNLVAGATSFPGPVDISTVGTIGPRVERMRSRGVSW